MLRIHWVDYLDLLLPSCRLNIGPWSSMPNPLRTTVRRNTYKNEKNYDTTSTKDRLALRETSEPNNTRSKYWQSIWHYAPVNKMVTIYYSELPKTSQFTLSFTSFAGFKYSPFNLLFLPMFLAFFSFSFFFCAKIEWWTKACFANYKSTCIGQLISCF